VPTVRIEKEQVPELISKLVGLHIRIYEAAASNVKNLVQHELHIGEGDAACMNGMWTSFCRDFRKSMNLRAWFIWTGLAAMGVFLFFVSGGKTGLLENNEIRFMSLFLPHMIFGSRATLSVYFDYGAILCFLLR
jgi:hypothetical protein